jgi:transaldolase
MDFASIKSPYQSKIKIYSDGADKASMLAMSKDPLIQGLTTNPSLMKKAGITNYKSFCQDVLSEIKNKPISFEVFADDLKEMKRQANEIKTWGSNVYVKIPITNSKGESCIPLVKELAQTGVRLNVTALLTMEQVTQTVLALKDGAPSIVSVFAGRIADTGRDPVPLMTAASYLCRSVDKNIELLWASSREFFNVIQAEQSGCHIITATPDLIAKIKMLNKDLSELSLDTVKQFKKDADAAGFTL